MKLKNLVTKHTSSQAACLQMVRTSLTITCSRSIKYLTLLLLLLILYQPALLVCKQVTMPKIVQLKLKLRHSLWEIVVKLKKQSKTSLSHLVQMRSIHTTKNGSSALMLIRTPTCPPVLYCSRVSYKLQTSNTY